MGQWHSRAHSGTGRDRTVSESESRGGNEDKEQKASKQTSDDDSTVGDRPEHNVSRKDGTLVLANSTGDTAVTGILKSRDEPKKTETM